MQIFQNQFVIGSQQNDEHRNNFENSRDALLKLKVWEYIVKS